MVNFYSKRARLPGSMDELERDIQLHKELTERRQRERVQRTKATFWIIWFVGLSVLLLNLPMTVELGLPAILDDSRLLFLISFSLLAGLSLMAYAFYYLKSSMASAREDLWLSERLFAEESSRLEMKLLHRGEGGALPRWSRPETGGELGGYKSGPQG